MVAALAPLGELFHGADEVYLLIEFNLDHESSASDKCFAIAVIETDSGQIEVLQDGGVGHLSRPTPPGVGREALHLRSSDGSVESIAEYGYCGVCPFHEREFLEQAYQEVPVHSPKATHDILTAGLLSPDGQAFHLLRHASRHDTN